MSTLCQCACQHGRTSGAGRLGRAVGRPGRLLAPAGAGGRHDAQQVDGVGLQALQEVLGGVAGQLHLRGRRLRAGAVGQAVGGDVAAAQLVRERLPRHLDVHRAAAGQAELRGPQGDCGGTELESAKEWKNIRKKTDAQTIPNYFESIPT